MRYLSTRGAAAKVGFSAALLAGLAPDGGLYSPEEWPSLSLDEIEGFQAKPYAEVAARILSAFAGDDLDQGAILADCQAAYGSFSHPAVTPLRQLDAGLWLLELFHGPTLAFKDVAMQLLARLYDRVLGPSGRQLTIVCATSGDTGGAAVEAFGGSASVKLVVLYPEGRISEVQRRFMTATGADNVRCLAVQGDFDDCQAILKAMFADRAFANAVDLSGVNSINWARIAAQSVYYFTSAAALGSPSRKVAFAVPTGNFGDAFAGYAAHRMGLPIQTIHIATNSNDILARTLEQGRYMRGEAIATQSPAMDIQVASNFERLYFEAVGRDAAETAGAFQRFSESGALDVPSQALKGIKSLFDARSVSEAETTLSMARALSRYGELVDPHTAVALCSLTGAQGRKTPIVALSTAHPAKFPSAVEAATGVTPALPQKARDLMAREERFETMASELEAVKTYVRDFARS